MSLDKAFMRGSLDKAILKVPVLSGDFDHSTELTTTSTTPTEVGSRIAVDLDKIREAGYRNLKLYWVFALYNDTPGETTYARLWETISGWTGLQKSTVGPTWVWFTSDELDVDAQGWTGILEFTVQLWVTGGTGYLKRGYSLFILGER